MPLAQLTPRRPLTAETELRGILATRLRRAEIDDLMRRLFAERDSGTTRSAAPARTAPLRTEDCPAAAPGDGPR